MNLKKIIRIDNKIYIKILEIPICKIEFDGGVRVFKLGGGILVYKTNKITLENTIRICGCSFKRRSIDSLKYKALYKRLKSKNLLHKHVYVFISIPSGELYIVLNLMNKIIKDKSSSDFLFVTNKKFKKDLCDLYFPHITCFMEKNLNLYISKQAQYIYKNITFYPIFTIEHYLKQDKKINAENIHYYDYILKDLELKRGNTFSLPKISNEAQQKIKNYVDKNDLNNFIILSPEANTSSELSKDFWQTLCNELEKNHIKVFLNIMKMKNYIDNCYVNYFTYEELIELAKYSKGIIGLRSGLIEILSTLNIPIYCFYNSFPQRGVLKPMSSKKAMIGFTLHKLPSVNPDNIYEYDVNKFSEQELIDNVLSQFKN